MLKITRYFTKYSKTYRINLREQGLGEITISRHTTVDGTEWKPATVNWAGCGDQPRHLTEQFVFALNTATYLCGTLNTGEEVTQALAIQDESVPAK